MAIKNIDARSRTYISRREARLVYRNGHALRHEVLVLLAHKFLGHHLEFQLEG